MPLNFSIKSTNEFLEIIRCQTPDKMMASLDVESLFTNVPVEETIEIILKYVYHNDDPEKFAPAIPEHLMKVMLLLCTTECPFYAPDGSIYQQKDGVIVWAVSWDLQWPIIIWAI
jgi:hypothetical protein